MKAAAKISRAPEGVSGSPDPAWRSLYRAGAVSALLYVVMILVPVVLLFAAPQPPISGGADVLQYIAEHKSVYVVEMVSFVGLSLPAIVVFLALYAALQGLDRSYAALGAVIGIASEIVALAYNSSPPSLNGGLLYLSDQYASATSDAQRDALATAAESLIAVSNTVNAAGILTALGILIFSLVMLKGVFSRSVAYLGITTGAVGIVCEILRDAIGAGYFVYGLLLPGWFIAVGWQLYRLAGDRRRDESRDYHHD